MFLSETEYTQVINLIDKKVMPGPLLSELKAWALNSLQITMYDYICDTTVNGLTRLKIVLWDYEAERAMMDGANLNPEYQKMFAKVFSALARKYDLHPGYHNEKDIFVCYDTIKDEVQKNILKKVRKQIEGLKDSGPWASDVWKIEIIFGGIHIFYETDAQIVQHEEDGISKALREECTRILQSQDSYNAFEKGALCTFTSKQTLDEKYAGSMFYYTR